MVKTTELVAALDEVLDAQAFQDGQENGLQIEGSAEIERIVSAVSVNQETIDAAIEADADALLTHHGLLWQNQPLHVQGVRRKRLASLLAHDINLITYHLPLDAHATLGNNAALADAAGCADVLPAFQHRGRPIGLRGELDAAFEDWMPEFAGRLRADCAVETGPFQVWPFGPDRIRSVGFLSGAAPYQVQDAIDLGLDAYVTGETTEGVYHLAKEAGIHVIAAGHYLSERGGVQRLGAWCERFDVAHGFVDVQTEA